MSQPRLSICIATVNRAAFIGATLDSIISQLINQEDDEVEIVIVDGASTDNTEAVVKAYQGRFSGLRYHRLLAKGGVDQDYCQAVDLAVGDYCWLFTDDDILKPGAIRTVLAELHHYGLIVVNAEVRNANLSEVLEARRLPSVTDRVYRPEDVEPLFVDTVDYLSFIGGVVIKRSIWNERDKQSYYGTVFVHVGVIFQAPLPGGAAVLAEPLISIRYGNALWTPRGFDISLFKWPELVWSFPLISEFSKRQVVPREPWHNLKGLLIYRARGAFSMREYRALLKLSGQSRLWRVAARVIAVVPGIPLNAGLVIFFSAFGRFYSRNGMRLIDLENSRFSYKRILPALGGWFRAGQRQSVG